MDQLLNPFDESVMGTGDSSQEAQDPFNDASINIQANPINTEIINELIENDVPINNSETVTDKCQPKPDFSQGVVMQTQGQPFTMPGAPPEQGGANNGGGFNPQEGFNPTPQQGQGGFVPQQNPGFAPQQNPGFNPQQPQQGQGGFAPQPQNPGFAPQQNPGFNPQPQQNQGFPQQNPGFNPQQGGGFPQQNQGGGFPQHNNQNSGTPEKYAIVDMFWFVNKKLYANQPLVPGESQLLTVGFNAAFNNMRIGMCSDKGGAFTDSSIIIQNCERLANFNIFSEHALQILFSPGVEVRIFERVIRAGSWSPNVSSITNNGNTFVIKSTNPQNGNVTSFIVADEQVIGFTKALEFLLNGQSWNMALTGTLNR